MTAHHKVRVGRIYDQPNELDGTRVLVDRIWPRGIGKDEAALDAWLKQIAPSTQLRTWYAHDPKRFDEFKRHYCAELEQTERAALVEQLRELAQKGTLTLFTATRRVDISNAAVLAELINQETALAGGKTAADESPDRSPG